MSFVKNQKVNVQSLIKYYYMKKTKMTECLEQIFDMIYLELKTKNLHLKVINLMQSFIQRSKFQNKKVFLEVEGKLNQNFNLERHDVESLEGLTQNYKKSDLFSLTNIFAENRILKHLPLENLSGLYKILSSLELSPKEW